MDIYLSICKNQPHAKNSTERRKRKCPKDIFNALYPFYFLKDFNIKPIKLDDLIFDSVIRQQNKHNV
jgi:hypothetical protein